MFYDTVPTRYIIRPHLLQLRPIYATGLDDDDPPLTQLSTLRVVEEHRQDPNRVLAVAHP